MLLLQILSKTSLSVFFPFISHTELKFGVWPVFPLDQEEAQLQLRGPSLGLTLGVCQCWPWWLLCPLSWFAAPVMLETFWEEGPQCHGGVVSCTNTEVRPGQLHIWPHVFNSDGEMRSSRCPKLLFSFMNLLFPIPSAPGALAAGSS